MLSTLKLTAFVTSGVVMTNGWAWMAWMDFMWHDNVTDPVDGTLPRRVPSKINQKFMVGELAAPKAASLINGPVVPGLGEPWGCCYNVGFGDGMEECCQSPTQGGDIYLSECKLEQRMGGATWFVEFETCEWMEQHVWCGADCTNYPLFKIVKPNEASSALNLARRDSRGRRRDLGLLNLARRDSVDRGRRTMSLAAASSDPMGCCFNVYFTGSTENGECCETPTQGGDVRKSNCQIRSWTGGATWFVENETCAWMEQNLWNKGLPTSKSNVMLDRPEATLVAASGARWGCCFNVGFGDGMKECCQSPTQGGDVQLSSCNLQNRMGGATWFVEFQTCQWLEDNIWSKGYATTTANVMLVQPQSPSLVAAVLDPALAERVHGGVVRGLAPTWGCCFNVGFGAGMKECCQGPTQGGDIELSSCNLQNRMGGATWFVEFQTCQWLEDNIWSKGYATTSANVMLVQPESPPSLVAAIWDPEGKHGQVNGLAPTWGCCFDVGFGSRMKECCQEPTQGGDILLSSCNLQNRIGGATWFVEFQTCQWLKDNIWSRGFATTTANVMLVKPDSASMVAPIIPAICPGCPDNSQITAAVRNPQGCCFNVGFGDGMRECCQEPTQGGDVRLLDCKLQQRIGGATWFVEYQTCQWMRENIWSKGFLTTSSNVRVDMPHSPSMVAPIVPAPAVTPVMAVYDPEGCCFDVGFGAFMKECCQTPTQGGDVRRSSCHLKQGLGGATWFVEGQTCAWMQKNVWSQNIPTTYTNVRLDKPSF